MSAAHPPRRPSALIAEDEPLLAQALRAELAGAWPELSVPHLAADGESAVQLALAHSPDVLFFDIRMPGQDGLDAAAELAERWPAKGAPFPLLVFVTAYNDHALAAFEAQATDYLLKPVRPERLARTVGKLREQLALRAQSASKAHQPGDTQSPAAPLGLDELSLARLRALLALPQAGAGQSHSAGAPMAISGASHNTPTLSVLAVSAPGSQGNTLRMIPIEQVLVLEAADKYVRVLTAEGEHLVRTPLRELAPRLDPKRFWQIHRSTVVRVDGIDTVSRDESGRMSLTVRGLKEHFGVSRLYADRFKAL